MNKPNPNYKPVEDILNEIGDPNHAKEVINEIRPTLPDEPTPKPDNKPNQESKPDSKPSQDTKPADNSSNPSNTTPSNPTGNNPPSSGEYFSHWLSEEEKKKLARYERLHFAKIPDNWEEEVEELKKNKKPFDLPPTWREELKQIEELRKCPTWEELHKAVSKEKVNYKDYGTLADFKKSWSDLFGTTTPEQLKKKLEEKPTAETISPEDKEAIKNYAKLKENYNKLSELRKKDIDNLKNQIKIKNAEIDKLKGWKTQLPPDSLVEQIRQKIVQAYNSTDYLNGYYDKLMKQFLNWEITGNEQQKNALKETKIEINKCVAFLEKVAEIKNPNIRQF